MKDKYTPGQDCGCYAYSESECGCDADWTPSEVYELREKLAAEHRRQLFNLAEESAKWKQLSVEADKRFVEAIRERDEARAYADKLAAGLPEGMLPKDVEVLRDANLALAVERDSLQEQLTAERALADRLAGALRFISEECDWQAGGDHWNGSFGDNRIGPICDEALAAWKEARSE